MSAGPQLSLVKKQKLPLAQAFFEKKGGWGRSLSGAEQAIQKLRNNPEGKCTDEANDLESYVEVSSGFRTWAQHTLGQFLGSKI